MNFSDVRSLLWDYSRRGLKQVHLWLGLASSLVLTVVCFSGALYVFNTEVIELLNRDKIFVDIPPNKSFISHEVLIQKVADKTSGTITAITVPANNSRAYVFNIRKDGERRGSNYYVNPYSGEIASPDKMRGQEFFRTVLRLHRWLLLDTEIGRPIVGWSTIIMTLLILSGLVIWLPRNVKYWYKGLKVKFSGNAKRVNFEMHRGLGYYAAIFILIMALTGPFWSFNWYRQGVHDVLGVEMPQRRAPGGAPQQQQQPNQQQAHETKSNNHQKSDAPSERVNGQNKQEGRGERRKAPKDSVVLDSAAVAAQHVQHRLAIAKYIQKANDVITFSGNTRLAIPAPDAQSIIITKSRVGFFAPSGADRVELNLADAEVIMVDRFFDKPINQQLAGSIKALHTGEIFGLFTKILYFIAALIASSLPTTGFIIWLNKRRMKANAKI